MINYRYDLNKLFDRKQKKQEKQSGPYRHIVVRDKIDAVKKVRSLTVECPLEYPGLTEKERRRMYEGLAMIGDAFRDADARCERNYLRGAK